MDFPIEEEVKLLRENIDWYHEVLSRLGVARKNRDGIEKSFFLRMCALERGMREWD